MNKKYIDTAKLAQMQLELLEKQFEEVSSEFIWQVNEGGGLDNIHMEKTISRIDSLYKEIKALKFVLSITLLKK